MKRIACDALHAMATPRAIENLPQDDYAKCIIIVMDQHIGKIVIKNGAKPWDHELRTAEALCASGFDVTFLIRNEALYRNSADIEINGCEWEIKSPISNKLSNIQKTLRKAAHQAPRIIYDSQRVKDLTDFQIERELRKQAKEFKSIKRVILVNKQRAVIDIK